MRGCCFPGAALCGVLAVSPVSALDEAGFAGLHSELSPPAGEGWRSLPWQESVLAARWHAAAEKKPVYLLVRSGNPLGCV